MFLSLKADNYTGIFSTPVFYLFNDNMQDKLGTCFDLLDNTFELFSQIGLDCLDVIKTHKMTGKLYFMRSKTSHIQLVIFFDEKCVAYFNEYGIAYRPFFIIDYY